VLTFPELSTVATDDAYAPFPCQVERSADLWFAEHTADVERAKALCGPCPIRQACLAGALERAEPWGVWGGEVFVDGVVVASKRGRGRPRKTPAPTEAPLALASSSSAA